MAPIAPGSAAPPVSGLDLADGPRLLFFYKVTCPVCVMAAPVTERIGALVPGRVAGVGQDPSERLASFGREHGLSVPWVQDPPPYEASDAYGIRVVPTLVLVDDGVIARVAESWDRDEWNRMAEELSTRAGTASGPVSEPGDGLPSFRPG